MKKWRIRCTVGVCVFNEEQNIARLLTSLAAQRLNHVAVGEIIVVASGSRDKTVDIVKQFMKRNKKIRLITESRRRGKASAVNIVLSQAQYDIIVLTGGDLILSEYVLERLVSPMHDSETGMTGARPVPVNDASQGLAHFAAFFLWDLHHRLSLHRPKMGEVVAFRKIFRRIPAISSVDEANIEPLIRGQGYRIKYVPRALVYNKAPATIAEFIRQRRRIYSGHLAVKHEQSYEVSTMNAFLVAQAITEFMRANRRTHAAYLLYIPLVMLLEAYSRLLGWYDYRILRKRHTVWDVAHTTKNLGR